MRGCTYDAEQDAILTATAPRPHNVASAQLDDGALLRTLTECVAQLSRQPLSVDMKREVEQAKLLLVAAEQESEQATGAGIETGAETGGGSMDMGH